jgi:hypothetical protein
VLLLSEALQDNPERGIQSAVSRILAAHEGSRVWVRLGFGCDPHGLGAGCINGRPDRSTYTGEQSGSKSGAFFGLKKSNRTPINVRLDLTPER